jgi:hypothetical protein
VLDSRGLRKVKKFYVVATEDEIGRSFTNILPVYDAIEAALNQFMVILQVEDKVQYLDSERILAETRLRSLQIQISGFPDDTLSNNAVIKNAANINAVNTLRDEQQRTLAYLNQVCGAFEIARKNLVSTVQKQTVWNEFLNQRADFLKATKELRQLVDKAADEYARLKKDPDVKDALQTIRRTNPTVLLGPSKDLTIVIGKLRSAEEMVSFDPDAYRRRSKRKSKTPAAPRLDPNRLERPRIANPEPTGDLVLTDLAVSASAGGNYVDVEGRFRNTSGRDLQRIRVTVFMEDRAGKLVKWGRSLIRQRF